ncbi:MAG: hypothetical protein ACI8QC_002453 [Planctomycetota bacterium]|jgi:hypothetical protein
MQPGLHTMAASRRAFLSGSAVGLGHMALASLGSPALLGGGAHFAPKAKRVIHLYMAGGPSHLETFDDKPALAALDGKPMPESFTRGQQLAQLQGRALNCFAPRFPFRSFGESGLRICEKFPHIGALADKLCIVNSMRTDQINHDPAHTLFNTGTTLPGRPSMGSWINYGLGSLTQNLPAFVVLASVGRGGQAQPIAARQWHSGFLPSRFQGVELRSTGDPVLYVSNPPGVDRKRQREVVDAVQALNGEYLERSRDAEARTRIAQYELAFRMQASVPELVDLSSEPRSIRELYGTEGGDGSFASNCLMARRMAERGVRFIQVYHRAWDHHGGIKRSIELTAEEVDRASAALILDLEQRGMLEDTLVLWGGEFGRTPMAQGDGRDHHIKGFSYMLAGGGIQGGMCYGKTDELGYAAVEDVVHVRDLHATILNLLGIDHERLTHEYRGLDLRLTGVEPARVMREWFA